MKAQELRIGNYILMHDTDIDIMPESERVVEVIRIQENVIEVHSNHFQFWDVALNDKEGLIAVGIPVTEEWLLKLGFSEWKSNRLSLEIPLGRLVFTKGLTRVSLLGYQDKILGTPHKYVHEVQNLYYSLTKTEL